MHLSFGANCLLNTCMPVKRSNADMVQAEAVKVRTLREVEGSAQRAAGPDASPCSACCTAVEQHLHEEPYSQQVRAMPDANGTGYPRVLQGVCEG